MLPDCFKLDRAISSLAPMQDVTDEGFMACIAALGCPDFFISEFFRVTQTSKLEPHILRAVLSKPKGREVSAQIIGNDIPSIQRTIENFKDYEDINCIDLNCGCPAPKVYKKNVGGSLLKEPKQIDAILKAMRAVWGKCLSVKMRVGFDNDKNFLDILKVIEDNGVNFVSLHCRTVTQLYRGKADYAYGKLAVDTIGNNIPIIINGDITSAKVALEVLEYTKARGVMVGRSAIRNPWIFRQINEAFTGQEIFIPKFFQVREFIDILRENSLKSNCKIKYLDGRMKKFINFIAVSVDSKGDFLDEMRKAQGIDSLMKVCDKYLLGENAEKEFSLEPFPNLCSRPNHEL